MAQILLLVCGGIGIVWYVACILLLGFAPHLVSDPQFYQFTTLSITTIGGALATYVGMIMGFTNANVTRRNGANPGTPTKISNVQVAAAIVYPTSLLLAMSIWIWHLVAKDKCDPAIIELAKSLLGLIVGALMVTLNVQLPPAPPAPAPPKPHP